MKRYIGISEEKVYDTEEWMIPCNVKYYDIIGAFNELKNIKWKQSVNIKVNDIVYIYVGNPYKEIKFKCIARKVNLTSNEEIDDSKFIKDDSNYKNTGRYMELELIEEYENKQLSLMILKEHGIKSVQGPCRISNELSEYIDSINSSLGYEREVISIPAAGTIDLIYKYGVHAHPNSDKGYSYKKALFYTFREKGGVMKKLYEVNKTIILDPNEVGEIDEIEDNVAIKERIIGYIDERRKAFKFSEEGEYKFYILDEPIELLNEVSLPKQNNHAYFTIDEIYSGKQFITRCNGDTKNRKIDLIDKIERKSNIEYVEEEYQVINQDRELTEGEKYTKIIEVKRRNTLARKLKLEKFKEVNGKVYCEVCGIDDEIVLDVHHDKVSVADMEDGHITKIEDLRIVCANCHRKIHGLRITVDRLMKILD